MRILVCAQVPPSAESVYWHSINGMEIHGHQVVPLDVLALQSLYGPDATDRLILQAAMAYNVNVALVFDGVPLSVPLLGCLRQLGVVLVAFQGDDSLFIDPDRHPPVTRTALRQKIEVTGCCDLVITCCRAAVALYAGHGLPPPCYLPPPYTVAALARHDGPMRPVVRFAGSPRYRPEAPPSWRVRVIRALVEAGLPVELAHAEWQKVPGCAHLATETPGLHDFYRDTADATVNLVLTSEFGSEPIPSYRGLVLQVAATGGLLLTNPFDEFADFFIDGADAVIARSPEAFVVQARHFLSHPDEARRIGHRGRQVIELSHSWQHWWEQVAERLAAKGIRLALNSPPHATLASHRPGLALAISGLAHMYESHGHQAVAEGYFRQILSWYPDDYAALAGLARISPEMGSKQAYWRSALAIQPAMHPLPAGPFPTAVIGPMGTDYRAEAGIQLLATSWHIGDHESVAEALLSLMGPETATVWADATLPETHIRGLIDVGAVGLAEQCLVAALALWPDDIGLLQVRDTWPDGVPDRPERHVLPP